MLGCIRDTKVMRCGVNGSLSTSVIVTQPIFNLFNKSLLKRIAINDSCQLTCNTGHICLLPKSIGVAASTFSIVISKYIIEDKKGAGFTEKPCCRC